MSYQGTYIFSHWISIVNLLSKTAEHFINAVPICNEDITKAHRDLPHKV